MGTERYDPGGIHTALPAGSEQADLRAGATNWRSTSSSATWHVHACRRDRWDVHFASATGVCHALDQGRGAAAASRILQCTASAAKNQWPATIRAIIRGQRSAQRLLKGETVELGWDGDPHALSATGGAHPPGSAGPPHAQADQRARRGMAHGHHPRRPAQQSAQRVPANRPRCATSGPAWAFGAPVVPGLRPERAVPSGAGKLRRRCGRAPAAAGLPVGSVRLLVFGNNLGIVDGEQRRGVPGDDPPSAAGRRRYDGCRSSTHHSLYLAMWPAAGSLRLVLSCGRVYAGEEARGRQPLPSSGTG